MTTQGWNRLSQTIGFAGVPVAGFGASLLSCGNKGLGGLMGWVGLALFFGGFILWCVKGDNQ